MHSLSQFPGSYAQASYGFVVGTTSGGDEGISGTRGRDKRPGLDALLKSVARREFDVVAAWSVCRLGRSLSDLILRLLDALQAPRFQSIYLKAAHERLDALPPAGSASS